jgi:hypothetical protein
MAAYADLMMGRPTPSQAELDQIKEGTHLRTKSPSGAPPAVWPIGWAAPLGAHAAAAGSRQAPRRAAAPPRQPPQPQPPQPRT